ncbi:hypothetical protein BB561_002604 [Smittium simulii]|uniref:Nucleosome assembly protein n=1 Tax=Smittium simulii TaxID=133385 RepID=A0A2T9YPR9_9FUNG|nr:hypothetical protein BB561_002604 [Smittium simulii]
MDQQDSAFSANVEELFNLQETVEPIISELHDEIYKIQAKYELKKAEFYTKRAAVIAKIPNFWQRAIENQAVLSTLVESEDSNALEYLVNIRIDREESNPTAFKIIFEFKENPYFTNSELVQTVNLSNREEPIISNAPIEWKEGKVYLAELIANDFYPNALNYFQGEFGDDISDNEGDDDIPDDDSDNQEPLDDDEEDEDNEDSHSSKRFKA